MTDQPIEAYKKVVEAVLFDATATNVKRLDAQYAFAQLMQELKDATTSSGYFYGYRAGWNAALHMVQNHCVDERKS
jgi:hypothetical protein